MTVTSTSSSMSQFSLTLLYAITLLDVMKVKDRLAEQEGSDLKTKSSPALPMTAK